MRRLWDITNRLFHEESVASVFLVLNIICWTVGTLVLGMVFCIIAGVSVAAVISKLMCAAIYAGVIMGLFGGIFFLMRRQP